MLKLRNNDATEENILKIIRHIKDIETKRGLTESEIEHKYTYGYCSSLVEIVQHFLPECKSILFWGYDEDVVHFCVGVKCQAKSNIHEDLDYYDINGKKSYDEMVEWMAKEFNGKIEGIFVQEMEVSRSNEIQDEAYSTICIEKENVQML
ncbi:MAG: hypothetical protein IJA72_03815 [Clostridia bacterium]|nr:hypothetical protein [Clostridia bacterium]